MENQYNQFFILLTSPPATGKTRLVFDLYENNGQSKIIFFSPLKALANELYDKKNSLKNIFYLETSRSFKEKCLKINKLESFFIILTYECLDSVLLDFMELLKSKILIIFDEFHLIYKWGLTFRKNLWEAATSIVGTGASVIGLSATIDKATIENWEKDFSLCCDALYFINYKNNSLKNYQENCLFPAFLGSSLIKRRILNEVILKGKKDVFLIFCRYRGEVHYWENFLNKHGILTYGCVGGEVSKFKEKMNKQIPECIVSTSVLSHGVNLPNISKIFITYELKERWMWIQMVGRGGRFGEKFSLYSMNSFYFDFWENLLSAGRVIIFDIFIRIKFIFGYSYYL